MTEISPIGPLNHFSEILEKMEERNNGRILTQKNLKEITGN